MDKQDQFNPQQQRSQTPSSQVANPESREPLPSLPQGRHTQQSNGFRGSLYLSKLVEERCHSLVPLLGYGLLLLALFDYIYILNPLRFTNPFWELQTIGALVEHTIAPLLGLMFVFYRREGYIGKLEKKFLGFLSWVSLLLGLLYLLMLPLAITDTWRIYQSNNAQIAAQLSQRNQQLQPIKEKLNQAKTDEQIQKLLASFNPQGRSPAVQSPQTFKNQLLSQISQVEQNLQAQADKVQTNQGQQLMKNSVKWSLGALITGTLFVWIWHLSDWTRIRQY